MFGGRAGAGRVVGTDHASRRLPGQTGLQGALLPREGVVVVIVVVDRCSNLKC